MKRSSGFTLIELLVTITIMVILMTLAVVNLRSTQANARDEDRKTDITNIARTLDSLYTSGITFTDSTSTTYTLKGSYPATAQMNDTTVRDQLFKDLPNDSRIVSGATVATDSIITTDTSPSVDIGSYIYAPLKVDGTACTLVTDECRKFTITCLLENGLVPDIVKSRNQ